MCNSKNKTIHFNIQKNELPLFSANLQKVRKENNLNEIELENTT